MHGLFGILERTHKSISEDVQETVFKKMGDALRRHKEDRLEQGHISGSNLLIERIGHSSRNSAYKTDS